MYERIIAYVKSQPWAIAPYYAHVMQEVLRLRAAGVTLSDKEIERRIVASLEATNHAEAEASRARARAERDPDSAAVAVVPVFGIIGHRIHAFQNISGPRGTSTEGLAATIRALAADSNVSSIVLDLESPGGGVFGLEELAEEIRTARRKKTVVAVANAYAASAAYWIASQASELVVTPSGQVGSIGVFSMHENMGEQLKALGIDVTLISAGKFKTEGNPFEPLDGEAREAIQKEVDAYYAKFTKDVAKGRGISVEKVRSGFGQGRMVNADDALREGMVDRIATFDDVLRELAAGPGEVGIAAAEGGSRLELAAETPQIEPISAETEPIATENTPKQEENEPAAPPPWQADVDARKRRLRILELS